MQTWLLGRDETGARRVKVNVIAGALEIGLSRRSFTTLLTGTPNPTNRIPMARDGIRRQHR
jgi:hypothetical protein